MKNNKDKKHTEQVTKWQKHQCIRMEETLDYLILILTSIIAVISVIEYWPCSYDAKMLIGWGRIKYWGIFIAGIILFIFIIIKVCCLIKTRITEREYEQARLAECLSEKAMNALKNVNAAKTRGILQSTYGRVSTWRPTDYCRNVLPYDVHEHLRTILIELQRLIIETSEGLNDETVAVDLVYCYPDEKEHHSRCVNDGNERKWRIITNSTETHCSSIYSFIDSRNSFYESLQKEGTLFYNDKNEAATKGQYIISERDKLYQSQGSCAGMMIELRNDEPEKVFVRAILTIITYGTKLHETHDSTKAEDYEEIFKDQILRCYKSLINSELAQMYIRHAITEGYMCRRTGRLLKKDDDSKKTTNGSSQKEYPCQNNQCKERLLPCEGVDDRKCPSCCSGLCCCNMCIGGMNCNKPIIAH